MKMVEINGRLVPLGTGRYRDLAEFLAAPAVDEFGCYPCPWTVVGRRSAAICPRTGRKRDVHQIAFEIWTGKDAETGTVRRCQTSQDCLNPEHHDFQAHLASAHKRQPTAEACGAGHPWNADSIREVRAVRNGKPVLERLCRICHVERKRKLRERERRWREMGWTP